MKILNTYGERQREVAESACGKSDCAVCRDYVLTGKSSLRPVTREAYMARLRESYPGGIPDRLQP